MSELVWDLQDASEFYEAIQRVRELLDYWDGLTESELGFERQIISGLIDAVKYALDGKK